MLLGIRHLIKFDAAIAFPSIPDVAKESNPLCHAFGALSGIGILPGPTINTDSLEFYIDQ